MSELSKIQTEKAILRIHDVEEIVGLKKSKIYDLKKQGLFPENRKIVPGATNGAVGWDPVPVYAWAKSRMGSA